jgi:hypothetical protein
MGRYAAGLVALAQDDVPTAVAELSAGAALPQEIPALAGDMRRLLDNLQTPVDVAAAEATPGVAPIFLTGYGQSASRDD